MTARAPTAPLYHLECPVCYARQALRTDQSPSAAAAATRAFAAEHAHGDEGRKVLRVGTLGAPLPRTGLIPTCSRCLVRGHTPRTCLQPKGSIVSCSWCGERAETHDEDGDPACAACARLGRRSLR